MIPAASPIHVVDELNAFSVFGLDVWLLSGWLVLFGSVEVADGESVVSGFSGSSVAGITVGVAVRWFFEFFGFYY